MKRNIFVVILLVFAIVALINEIHPLPLIIIRVADSVLIMMLSFRLCQIGVLLYKEYKKLGEDDDEFEDG